MSQIQGLAPSSISPEIPVVVSEDTNLSDVCQTISQQAILQFGVASNPINSLANRTITAAPKLYAYEIFEKIRKSICLISGEYNQGTGFLYKDLVITSFHLLKDEIRKEITFEQKKKVAYTATTETIRVESQGQTYYEVYFPIPTYEYESMPVNTACINYLPNISKETLEGRRVKQQIIDNYFEKCRKLDIITLKNYEMPAVDDQIEIIDDTFTLREGMKVYFGGYPLSQNSITFGKGLISSIEKHSTDVQYFIIDGTSVAGNSGSPVFIQHQGKVYLIGIVLAQIANWGADVSKDFAWMNVFNTLSMFQRGERLPSQREERLSVSKSHDQAENIYLNELFFKSIVALKNNISTGIGKVIDIRCLDKLRNAEFSQENLRKRNKFGEIPIAKSQKTVIKLSIKDSTILKSLGLESAMVTEIRRNALDRDVKISLKKGEHFEDIRYKIYPSPHCDETNHLYTRESKTFYRSALITWGTSFISNKAIRESKDIFESKDIPENFKFKAYHQYFQATRVELLNGEDLPIEEQNDLNSAKEEFHELELDINVENIKTFLKQKLIINGYRTNSASTSSGWEKWTKGSLSIDVPGAFYESVSALAILTKIYENGSSNLKDQKKANNSG